MNFYPISGTVPPGSINAVVYQAGVDAIFQITPPSGQHIDAVTWNGTEIDLNGNSGGSFVSYDKTIPQTFTLSGVANGDQIQYGFVVVPETRIFNAPPAGVSWINQNEVGQTAPNNTIITRACSTLRTVETVEISFSLSLNVTNNDWIWTQFAVGLTSTPQYLNANHIGNNTGNSHVPNDNGKIKTGLYLFASGLSGDTGIYEDNTQVVSNSSLFPSHNDSVRLVFEDDGGVYRLKAYINGALIENHLSTVTVGQHYVSLRLCASEGGRVIFQNIGLIGNFS